MYYGPTPSGIPDEVRAKLEAVREREQARQAARERALNRVLLAAMWIPLLAALASTAAAFRYPIWLPVYAYAGLFSLLAALALLRRLPFALRAGVFLAGLYAAAVMTSLMLGAGISAGLAFAALIVVAATLFGLRAGSAAALISALTWAGLATGAIALGLQITTPFEAGTFAGRIAASESLLLMAAALILRLAASRLEARAASQPEAKAKEIQALPREPAPPEGAAQKRGAPQPPRAEAGQAAVSSVIGRATRQYAVVGVLFGLLFPIVATLWDAVAHLMPITLESMARVQSGNSLHWVIDTAPIILGLFAMLVGLRQDRVNELNVRLGQQVQERTDALRHLEALESSLEQQVADRTADLARASEQASRRAARLEISAEVARASVGVLKLNELLPFVTQLISQQFGFYHAGVFLLDEAREWAVLKAANSAGGQRMLARNHRLHVGTEGIVGYVTGTGKARIALDVGADAVHFANPDLPDTHSEMALPLEARGAIIGALDVQSTEVNAFTDEDVRVLQALANQLAVAIDNARLFAEAQRRLEEMRALQEEARRAAAGLQAPLAFRYDGVEVKSVTGPTTPSAPGGDTLRIPLRVGGEELGEIEIKRQGSELTQDDRELTEAIATRMALALESARLFETTRVSLAETARLYNASRAIAAAQSVDEILRGVMAHALEPHYARFVIATLELDVNRRVAAMKLSAVWDGATGAQYGQGLRYTLEQFPVLRLFTADGPTVIGSLEDSRLDGQSRALFESQGIQALAAIPLVTGGALTGVFLAETAEPHEFSPEELRPLQALADLASVAIENLRLLDETQRRIAELATINSLSQALTSQLELKALAELVGDRIRHTFGAKQAFVALFDSQTNVISIPYLAEGDERLSIAPFPLGQGLSSIIIRSRQPLLINTNAEARARELGAIVAGSLPKSFLGVPILVGEEVVGVLSVQSPDEEGLYTEADVRLLSTIAANVGVAVQNARLFEETQRRLRELATISTIGQTLASQLELQNLVDVVGEKILEAFGVTEGYIALYDRRTGLIEIPFFKEGAERLHLDPIPLGRGLASVVIQRREPVLINQDTERRAAELGAIITGKPAQSYLGVPIILGEEVIGVISVQSVEREGLFSEADARLLQTLATSVGVAIQNARLFAEARRRAQQLATAADVSRAASSVLDPDELIVRSVELIRERFDLYYAALFLVDASGQWAVLRHATGEAGRVLKERGHRLEVGGQSMVGSAVSQRRARIALDVGAESVRFANPLLPDTRSEMALPLVVGDTVFGAIDVQSRQAGAFATSDITVLETVADQLATALQNARLFAETHQRVSELAIINDISQALTSSLDLKAQLTVVGGKLLQIFSVPNGYVALYYPESNSIEFPFFSEAGELMVIEPFTLGQGVTSHIIQTRRPLLVNQDAERRLTELGARIVGKPARSFLGAPIIVGNDVIGVISVQSTELEGLFGDPEVNLLTTIAASVGAAIQNARLFAETQRRAQQLAAAADVGRAASSTLDLDTLLRDSVELIRDRFGFYHASVFIVEPGTEMAVVRESTGEAGRQLKARRHALAVGSKSLVGAATAHREPVVVQDVTLDPTHFKNPLLPDTRAEAVIPMLAGDTVVGALDVQSTTPGAFEETDVATLTTIADQLAVAVQNARLFDKTARQARREQLVAEITNRIRAAPDIDSMLRTAVSELRQALGVSHGAVRLGPIVTRTAPRDGNGHDGNGSGHDAPGHGTG